jgi:8-oxo-dGTP pyrophosphatase MutT (NUDIX family)
MRAGYHLSLWLMRAAHCSRALLARMRGREVPGVRVVVLDGDRVVLVRHWYAPFVWTLPGGGVIEAETPEMAAAREVLEETGLVIRSLTRLGDYSQGKGRGTTVFAAYTNAPLPGIKNSEIMESRYWPVSALPQNVYPGVFAWIARAHETLVNAPAV